MLDLGKFLVAYLPPIFMYKRNVPIFSEIDC